MAAEWRVFQLLACLFLLYGPHSHAKIPTKCPIPKDKPKYFISNWTWRITESNKQYYINVCGDINHRSCPNGAAVCSTSLDDKRPEELGTYKSLQINAIRDSGFDLIFPGKECNEMGNNKAWETNIFMRCGKTLGSPKFVDVFVGKEKCVAVFEFVTNEACTNKPGPEIPCSLYGSKNELIDLTPLIKTQGGHEVSSSDPAFAFYINVCRGITPQKDDKIGCKANSSMCRFNKNLLKADDVGSISYASNLTFHNGDVVLVYNTTVTVSGCPKHMNPVTTITFRCPGKNTGVRGPVLIGARYCAFEVLWETDYACPKHSVMETNSCVLSNEFVHFNLTKLTAAIRDDYKVYHNDTTKAGDTTQYIYYINVCHPLSFTCEDKLGSNSTVCQEVKDGSVRWSLGIISNQTLRYADGQLSLTYEHGSTCRNGLNRTTIIMFSCDPHAKIGTGPVFNSESYCFYYFDWKTRYACAPSRRTGTQCRVVSPLGVRYDLSELVRMENSTNWIAVDGESSSSNKKILMNVCGQVTGNPDAKQCDSSAAICMIDQSNGKVASLGRYIDPPTLNPDNSIKLVYLRGSECKKDNSGKSVFIRSTVTFVCQTGDLSSPPVLVTHSLDNCYYEFMWRTAAACSLGLNTGEDCRVEDKNAGYVFDLNPLANKTWHNKDFFNLTMKGSQYSYLLKVCGGSSRMDCGGTNVSACQIRRKDSKKFTLGLENKNLYYYDGMLNLTYQDGDKCHNGLPRTTHITFLCNQSAKDDGIGIPEFEKENHCTYNFRWFTKYACPLKIVECVARTDVAQYDLTSLVKTSDNWEATYKNKDNDKDKGKFYINVCRSLNLVPGCSVTAAVCLKKSNGKAINLGSVSNPPTEGVNNVVITYTDGEKCQGDKKYQTTITFLCKKGEESSSPEFIETADNGCTYKFNWITAAGCPIENVNGDNCIVHDPKSDTIFNLLPLRKKSNVAMYGGNVTENNEQATFQLNICGPLPDKACGDRGNISACLIRKNGQKIALGKKSMQLLYKGEIVTLIYRGGDNFETGEQREVHIKFYCNSKKPFGKPTFAEREEKSNKYIFEFQTSLVCSAKAVQCLVSDSGSGVEYDLSPMGLTKENWQAVDTRLQNKHLHYFINVCRAVNPIGEVLKCPGGAIGACQIDHSQDKGFNLGYVQSNPQITGKGELTLQYSGGTSCHKNQFSRSIRIVFSCSKLMGSPIFLAESPECEYLFSWETPSACPLTREVGHDCKVEDKQYGYMFNLSVLYSKSKDYNVNVKGGAPGERIILNVCNKLVGGPKGCIGEEVGACIIGARNTPVVLNKTLTYYNGQIQTTYGTKPAINITFECNQDTSGLDTGPTCEKKSNTYDCLWQTPFACRPMISVQCSFRDDDQDADNQYDYSSLSKSDGNWEAKVPPPNMDRVSFFINVCRTVLLKDAAKGCPPSSGVCMHKGFGKSLIYQALPLVCDHINNLAGHIVVIVSPLVSLMEDQVNYLQSIGVSAVNINSQAEIDHPSIEYGKYSLVFGSPEAWLKNDRWRSMRGNDVYRARLCAVAIDEAHVIRQWGKYYNLGTIRHGPRKRENNIYLDYEDGEPCGVRNKNYTTHILMTCGEREGGVPMYIGYNTQTCEYDFLWTTSEACPLNDEKEVTFDNCTAINPHTNAWFDLNRLRNQSGDYDVVDKRGYSYKLNVCGPLVNLSKGCEKNSGVCQEGKQQMHSAGISNKRLHFDDGILYLNLSGGEPCHHVEKNRETIIQFVCSPTRDSRDMGKPVFISENDCTYFFVWHTPLVCERQYECAALQNGKDGSTVKYSLSRLMRTDANWEVISEGSTKEKDVASYYVNLCRPLLPMPGKNCPAGSWACKVLKTQEGIQYQDLGKAVGPPEEVKEGHVKLVYNSTTECSNKYSKYMELHFLFVCSYGELGHPVLESVENDCIIHISWATAAACPDTQAVDLKNCRVFDNGTGQFYSLKPLMDSHGFNHFTVGKETDPKYFYLSVCQPLNLQGGRCKGDGVCMVTNGNGLSYTSLGRYEYRSMTFYREDEMMILRYCSKECGKGGTVNSTITFICDREQLKGGQPELIQSYGKNGADFIFRTSLVCPPLERECSYTYSGNTYDLQLLTSRTGSWNYTSRNKDRFWINICRGISDGPKGCPSHASVCMIRAGKDKVNVLGLTSTQMMTYQGGKLQLQYSGLPSDGCRKGVHPKVVFYFDCGSHVGQPSLSREEWSSCVVVINWKSSVACKVKRERIEENNCVVKHPVTGRIIDFKKLLNGSESTWKVIGRDEHVKEVSYYINVCDKLGKGTKDLPSGCNGDVASVCIENTPFTVTDKSIYYEDSIFSLEMTADKVVFVINFQCSEEKVGSPKFDYLSSNKHYFFTWTTSVVCAGELSREVTDIPEAGHKTVKSVGKKNLGIAFGVVFAVLLVIVFVVVFYKPSRRHKIISYLRVNFKTLVLRKEINYPTYRYQKLDVSDDDEADSLIKIAEGSDDEEENDDDDLLPF